MGKRKIATLSFLAGLITGALSLGSLEFSQAVMEGRQPSPLACKATAVELGVILAGLAIIFLAWQLLQLTRPHRK